MSKYATREDIDEVLDVLRDFMQQVDQRFVSIELDISEIKKSHHRLIDTVDGFVGRIDKYETELAARDAKIERLERWIEQIAKKTNVPMPS